jgi:LPXTG-site transpeptidase (sortase) family protein
MFVSRRTVLVTLVGVALVLAPIFFFALKSPGQVVLEPIVVNASVIQKPARVKAGLPVRLKIPGIQVDAVVEQVGLTADGAMGIPKTPNDVAWFNVGPRPGDTGSAVIDGHFGTWKNGQGSVFDNLYKLHTGDTVYVQDDKGVTVAFVVREVRTYDAKADATGIFSSTDNQSHLNFITCEGMWNTFFKSYPQRLVVFTDRK